MSVHYRRWNFRSSGTHSNGIKLPLWLYLYWLMYHICEIENGWWLVTYIQPWDVLMSTIDRSLKTGRITITRQLSKHNTPRMNVRRADPSRTICLIPSQGAEKLERVLWPSRRPTRRGRRPRGRRSPWSLRRSSRRSSSAVRFVLVVRVFIFVINTLGLLGE
jgi:hypothetical protein